MTGEARPAAKSDRARGDRGAAVLPQASRDPRAGEAAENGKWRRQEHEMADAVVHGRPRRDRHQDRQQSGEHDGNESRASPGRCAVAAPAGRAQRRWPRPTIPQSPSASISSGSVSADQCRHIAARHVEDRYQLAVEQLAPRLLEKVGEIFDGAKRIERREHRPRPNQPHDQIGEDRARNERHEE